MTQAVERLTAVAKCCRDRHGWRALVDDLDTLDNTHTLITPRGPVTL